MWNKGGSSSDPCDEETYMGWKAGSAPETQNVQNYLAKIKENLKYLKLIYKIFSNDLNLIL